ncbi:MAG: phytanoyl-CoA dioxygenase family protein [Alphaproteobacteria bacterium]|jgi:phytanoyl-CoA hydroxylase|nr:phytanoyl-CoA dioxygenase family protein [Alphaproteobacteria bacterium]
MLSPADKAAFHRDGFLIVPDFVTPARCDALTDHVAGLIAALAPAQGVSIFTTDEQQRHADARFFESAGGVSLFYEAGAVDPDGRLTRPAALAVNKIGHALHDRDPEFAHFSRDPRLAAIAGAIGIEQPRLVQSMVICKPPGIGGEVSAHQDATFIRTEPASVIGFWFALEAAEAGNGCLEALPGGHRLGLKRDYLRVGDTTRFVERDEAPWPDHGWVPLPASRGTLILLHGLLPHRSAPNRSDRSRLAYTLHVVDGRAEYLPDNWLRRRPDDPFTGF